MKLRMLWIVISVWLVSCGRGTRGVRMAEGGADPSSVTVKLDAYMRALTEMGQFNGVLYVSMGDSLILHKAYNTGAYTAEAWTGRDGNATKSHDTHHLTVEEHSQFDLRSVSKLLAKTALYEMEAEGKIDLNGPLSQYLQGFPFGDDVTIKQLMDHSSGLPRELTDLPDDALSLSPDEVIALIKKESLEFEPGTEFRYSNPGYQLLYYLIGKIAGKPYPQVLRERYFERLKMQGTGSHFLDPESRLSDYAYGHYLSNDRLKVVESLEREDMQLGHLFSTAEDMARFISYLAQSPVGELLESEGAITHAGGSRGKRAWVYSDAEKHVTIVFLANIDMIPFEKLTSDLVRMMNGEEVAIPQPVSRVAAGVDPGVLETYTGTYDFVDAGHLILEFSMENDSLVAWQKGQRAGALIPENDSVFFWDPKSAESVMFKTDSTGVLKAYMDFQGVRWEGSKIQ